MHVNFVDIVVLVVIALSALLALGRGFVNEVLSVFGWIGAVIGTLLIFAYVPAVREFARQQIAEPLLADIVVRRRRLHRRSDRLRLHQSRRSSSRIHGSSLGALDRSLGPGVRPGARRWCIVALAYMALTGLRSCPTSATGRTPSAEARTEPYAANGRDPDRSLDSRGLQGPRQRRS